MMNARRERQIIQLKPFVLVMLVSMGTVAILGLPMLSITSCSLLGNECPMEDINPKKITTTSNTFHFQLIPLDKAGKRPPEWKNHTTGASGVGKLYWEYGCVFWTWCDNWLIHAANIPLVEGENEVTVITYEDDDCGECYDYIITCDPLT